MRRQLSDSAVISTGRPERVNTKAISWSRFGPPRTVTRSGLRLTKRGNRTAAGEAAGGAHGHIAGRVGRRRCEHDHEGEHADREARIAPAWFSEVISASGVGK